MNNWETEYEIKYHFAFTNDAGKHEVQHHTLIIEASSKAEVVNIIQHKFAYSEELKIDEVKELWKY